MKQAYWHARRSALAVAVLFLAACSGFGVEQRYAVGHPPEFCAIGAAHDPPRRRGR
jgi:hypothetical protein